MKGYEFTLSGAPLVALGSGALWWPEQDMLVVSDLHLGTPLRTALPLGIEPPVYDTRDTLTRLAADIALSHTRTIVCLGNSFDGPRTADALPEEERKWIFRLQAGRRWVWIEGSHDPGPIEFGGAHLAELPLAPLTFRHVAQENASGEVSGHYHPEATDHQQGRSITRPAFLIDTNRIILPAYGTYSGKLEAETPPLHSLMRPETIAVLTGSTPTPVPMAR